MEKLIRYENLRSFAYSNDRICERIKGIVISFFGLSNETMYNSDTPEGIFFASHGILYVVPYNNPWAWMNRQAVDYTDEIIDTLAAKYSLPDNIPVVSTGASMGGMSSLVYAKYAKRTPVACVSNCPVCNMVYHFGERPDLPRTILSAYWNYEGKIEDVLKTVSPIHLAPEMPRIPYHIFHCTEDDAVNLHRHSEMFVSLMRDLGHSVTFDIVEGRRHCDLTDEMRAKYNMFSVEEIEKALS